MRKWKAKNTQTAKDNDARSEAGGEEISVFQAIFENNIKTFEKSLPFLNGKVVYILII